MFFKTQGIPYRGILMSAIHVLEELLVGNSFVTSDVSCTFFLFRVVEEKQSKCSLEW